MAPNTVDVRRFLIDYFSDEEVTTLCFDYFAEVYKSFASGMSKGQKIHLLIEYAQRRELEPDLLKVLQQQRPTQFVNSLELPDTVEPAPSPLPPTKDMPLSSTHTVSGGVKVSGDKVTVGHDVVGRDKLIQTGTYIEHATIIQASSSLEDHKPTAPILSDNQLLIGDLEFVRVPRGKFIMGSKADDELASDNEWPQRSVVIYYDFWLAKYPVTNSQFAAFVESTGYMTVAEKEGGWSRKENGYVHGISWRHPLRLDTNLQDKNNHPVVQLSWFDVIEYCKWLNAVSAKDIRIHDGQIRLPTEAEWEKAARGEYGNEWPWGDVFDDKKCNSVEGGKGDTTPVDAYSPQGDSRYGIADMAGNVWEWCHSLSRPYPYNIGDSRESEVESGDRILRGGSFRDIWRSARCAHRGAYSPYGRTRLIGFRVVLAPPLS